MSIDLFIKLIGGAVLLMMLSRLSWIDMTTGLLPDRLTLPLLWIGLLFNLEGFFAPLHDAVLGAVFGYVFLWLINYGHRHFAGHDGMGYGDFKLTAALGAWFGMAMLPWLMLGACVAGFGSHIARRRSSEVGDAAVPFGPSLAAAGVVGLVIVFSR